MSNPQPQPASLDDRVRDIIESFRPVTQAHGGDVEFVADFEVAVEEGATIVRVGRAIFGQRPI